MREILWEILTWAIAVLAILLTIWLITGGCQTEGIHGDALHLDNASAVGVQLATTQPIVGGGNAITLNFDKASTFWVFSAMVILTAGLVGWIYFNARRCDK